MSYRSGAGVPALTLGDIGDIYSDTTNKHLYEKTDNSTWTRLRDDGYSPAVTGNWSITPPTTLAGAIDDLAARVKALEP